MNLIEAKKAYKATVHLIYDRREELLRKVPAAHLHVLRDWVDCAELLAAVSYDVLRFQAQVDSCTIEENLLGLNAKLDELKAKREEMILKMPVCEKSLLAVCPGAFDD